MALIETLTLTGQSGATYHFDVYDKNASFVKGIAGVYYISKRTPKTGDGETHTAIYVGQASDIKDRLSGHENQSCFDRHGYNAISIHGERNQDTRLTKERDLIDALDPPCNQT